MILIKRRVIFKKQTQKLLSDISKHIYIAFVYELFMIKKKWDGKIKKKHFTLPLFINVVAGSLIIIIHKNRKDERVYTIVWLIYHV